MGDGTHLWRAGGTARLFGVQGGDVMDTDLMLVLGIVICALAIPSLFSAWVDGRVPRVASIMILIGGVLAVVALTRHGSGYTFSDMPDVFFGVIGRYIN